MVQNGGEREVGTNVPKPAGNSDLSTRIHDDLVKRAQAKLDATTQELAKASSLTKPELDAAVQMEKALLAGDTTTLSKIYNQLRTDPYELPKITDFVTHAIQKACSLRETDFAIAVEGDSQPHLKITGDHWESRYGPPEVDIYPNKMTGSTNFYDVTPSPQVVTPKKAAAEISLELIHDMVDK